MKRKTLITILQYVVFLGLGIWLIIHMSNQMSAQDKQDMFDSISHVRLWMLVPIFIAGFISHWARALRWKLLLKPLKIYPTTTNTVLAVLIGYVVNLLVPRMGEVAKCTILAKYENVPADKMIGTIVAERTFDVFTLGIITLIAFISQMDVIGEYAGSIFGAIAAKGILLVVAIAGLVLMVVFLVLVYRKYKESKVGKFIKGLADGVRSIIIMKHRGKFFLYTFLIWLMYWSQVYLGFLSLPATEHLSGIIALVVLVFGSVGMIATPGGIGAYPILLAQILVFYNINLADGNAFGWVSWSVQTGMVIIFGITSLIVLPIYNRRKHDAQAAMDTE